jgi:tRNA (guanine-N7-)-methyltransferase
MKPKDLKAAFTWEERRPMIVDRIFHVPNHYDRHDEFYFPGWDDHSLFGNRNPVCIEYCAGNGAWIVDRAKRFPELNWAAVEMRYDRVRKIWSKIKNEKLSNLIVVCGEAWTFTRHYVEDRSIEEAYINFPDPWPKEKHEKHRLMKPRFLDELARVLKLGKKVTFVSDDPEYVGQTLNVFNAHPSFNSYALLTDFPEYGASWFENLWRGKGKKIQYAQFLNRPLA